MGTERLIDRDAEIPCLPGTRPLATEGRLLGSTTVSGYAESMPEDVEAEKRLAAEAAAELVENGMTVGSSARARQLPTFFRPFARRSLSVRCVATSPHTASDARHLGIEVEGFAGIEHLDIAIDGADQIAPDGWLVKGGGGAHTREGGGGDGGTVRRHRRFDQARRASSCSDTTRASLVRPQLDAAPPSTDCIPRDPA